MRNMLLVFISFIFGFFLSILLIFSMNKGEAEIVVNNGTGTVINPGTIDVYSGSTAPDGYLLCNGQAVSREVYADLFETIGSIYGEGDGSTTFNVPNLNGKVPVGKGTNELANLGNTGGAVTTTLTVSNLPSHTHSISALSGTAASSGAHSHTVTAKGSVSSTFTGSSATTSTKTLEGTIWNVATTGYLSASGIVSTKAYPNDNVHKISSNVYLGTGDGYKINATHNHTVTAKGSVSSTFTGSSATTSSNGAHTHSVTTTASTTGSVGSGASFTNMQPYIVMNYIIKY